MDGVDSTANLAAPADRGDLKLLVVWATTRCQLRCRYCYMRAGEVPAVDLDERTFVAAIENLGLAADGEVQIAGGEPLLVPAVIDFIARHARARGVGRIGVQTNGVAIDDAFITLVRRYGLAVGVSLDAPATVNDRVRGQTGNVLRGLMRLEAAGIPFGVTAVVCRDTVATLPDLGLLLAGFSQARSLGLDILRPAGRATVDDLASPAELRRAFVALAERIAWVNRRRAVPLALRELSFADCGARSAYCPSEAGRGAALTADGRLYPCASLAGDEAYACGTAEAPDLSRLARGLRPDRSACTRCALSHCRGRCPSRALLSPEASRLDCTLRVAAVQVMRRLPVAR